MNPDKWLAHYFHCLSDIVESLTQTAHSEPVSAVSLWLAVPLFALLRRVADPGLVEVADGARVVRESTKLT